MIGLATGLARLGARVGAARREADDDNRTEAERQAREARAIQEETFRRWATEQTMKQAAEREQYGRSRDTLLDARHQAERTQEQGRQREQDRREALERGFESALPEQVGQVGQAALGAATGMQLPTPAPARTAPFRQRAGGVDVAAPDVGGPQYVTVGGQWMKLDRQRQANAEAMASAHRFAADEASDRRQIGGMIAAAGARSEATAARRNRLPVAKADELGAFNGLMGSALAAMDALDEAVAKGQDVTGPAAALTSNRLGNALGFQQEQEANSARALMANLSSQVMKERSGGAITPQEFERLEPFLTSAWDDEAKARGKVMDLYRELARIRDARLAVLGAVGFEVAPIELAHPTRTDFRPRGERDRVPQGPPAPGRAPSPFQATQDSLAAFRASREAAAKGGR